MITLEDEDYSQLNLQLPMNFPTNIHFPSIQKCNGTDLQDIHEVKDAITCHPIPDTIEIKSQITGDYAKTFKENHKEPIHRYGFNVLPAFYPVSYTKLNNSKALKGQFYSYYADNQFRYTPLKNIPQNNPDNGYKFQDFQYFVVIDFEATCDKVTIPNPQEIIEFPSVIVNGMTCQLEACFQTYVRPTCNRILSEFCKDLTGIHQFQVDRGVTLSEALLRHDKWLENKGVKGTNFAVVTWSNWDCRVMLESECRYKKIRKPSYFNRWINLKVPFGKVFAGARCNLKEAVEMAGLSWLGRPHCGLDDAKNTAFLLSKLMTKGFRFSITDSLVCDSTFRQPIGFAFTHYPSLRVMEMRIPAMQLLPLCYCGVKTSKGMVRKPDPMHGCVFLRCGNWTAVTGLDT